MQRTDNSKFKNKIKKFLKRGSLTLVGVGAIGFAAYKADSHRRKYQMEKQISLQTDKRFQKFMSHLMEREGGISPAFVIGENTSGGITQTTLDLYHKEHGDSVSHFSKNVFLLKSEHILEIYKNEYYDRRKIAHIENESVAELVFDLSVNHKPETWRTFAAEGMDAVGHYGHDSTRTERPKNWVDVVDVINEYNDKDLKTFYNKVVDERIEFFKNRPDISNYSGLLKRAQSFKGGFKSERTIHFYKAQEMCQSR